MTYRWRSPSTQVEDRGETGWGSRGTTAMERLYRASGQLIKGGRGEGREKQKPQSHRGRKCLPPPRHEIVRRRCRKRKGGRTEERTPKKTALVQAKQARSQEPSLSALPSPFHLLVVYCLLICRASFAISSSLSWSSAILRFGSDQVAFLPLLLSNESPSFCGGGGGEALST